MNTESIRWFAVGVWQKVKWMSRDEVRKAALEADKVLEQNPPGSNVSVAIPGFGQCSYAKCTAIAAVFICLSAKTDHVDSPILAAAREAKLLAGDGGVSDEAMGARCEPGRRADTDRAGQPPHSPPNLSKENQ